MIYIQTDISIESIKVGGTVAKGVARKLILTNNSLHTASTAYVRDINDDPYLYELMPIDGLGFDFADYLPGEYTLAVIGDEDEVLVENILVLRTVDNMEIFYDEEYPSEVIDQIPVISLEILDTINGEIIGVGYTDKTQAILESVLAIKAAIEEKGEEVGNDPLRTYADHIKKIETGSPATITIKQGDNEQSFQLNQKNDQTIEIDDQPHWFGTRAEYDAIEEKDPDTIYHVKEPIPYDDISGKPVIGDGKITIKQGDNEQTFTLNQEGDQVIEIEKGATDWDDIQNKPDFKPVATTGDYNDLDNKPVIEPVYNPFITIMQGGEEKGKFRLNQSNNQTIELEAGGEELPHWFGTQEEYDAIPVKDPDTIYHIEGGSDDKHWFGTQEEYDAIEVKDPDMIYCIEGGGGSDALILHAQAGVDPNLNKPAIDKIVRILSSDEPMPLVYVKAYGIYYGAVKIDLGREDVGVTTFSGVWERREVFLFDGTYRGIQNTKLAEAKDIKDSKVTIKQGDKEQSFTLNQEGDATIELDAGGSTTWDDIQDKPDFKPVATSGDYEDLTNKPEIPSIEGLASEEYVGNELKKYLPLVGGTLTGHLTIGSTSETAYKKFEAIRKVNNEGNGAAFYVNSDGTAAFYHKSYSASGSAVNDAILKFDSVGLMFAMGGNRTTSATEFKKVLLEGDIPEHRSESWTFELEDGSTVTKNIWLD